jgi:multidrug resistance efflux pump
MGFRMDNRARIDSAFAGSHASEPVEDLQDAQGLRRTLEQRLNEGRDDAEQAPGAAPAEPSRTPKRVFKAAVGIAVVVVFGWFPLQAMLQTSSVEAVVNSRVVTLRSPIDGQVISATNLSSERNVVDQGAVILRIVNTRGDRVRLDDLRRQRARLENERPTLTAKLSSAQSAQKDLARQAEQFREGRVRQLEARLAEIEATIGVAVARKEEATAAVERASSLARSGNVSTVEVARLMREQTIAQQNEHAARRRLDATQIELAAARGGMFLGDSYNDRPSSVQREEEMRLRADTLSADLAQVEAEIAWLSSELAAEEFRFGNQSEALVRLPVTGRIWEIMTASGEDVRAGQPLARVLDCSSTVVTANVTERVYNRLQIGDPARFHPADGTTDINGTIVNLTGAAGAAANLAINPDALSKEPYRITVAFPRLNGETSDCKVGRTGRVIFEGASTQSSQ